MCISEMVKMVKWYWPLIQDSVFLNTYVILIWCRGIGEIYAQLREVHLPKVYVYPYFYIGYSDLV